MDWDWNTVVEILPALLRGLRITIEATLLGGAVALILGLVWMFLRRSRHRIVSWPVLAFTEFIRGTPLLVQLYFIFFVLPTAGLSLSPLASGVLGIGLHYSTYTAEIYRAGIGSLPSGQWEAGMALDLPKVQLWRRIILPQAVPKVLPALGNSIIAMFKETALLSSITVQDVLGVAKDIGATTYIYTEPLLTAGFLYLVISYVTSALIRAWERRLATRG